MPPPDITWYSETTPFGAGMEFQCSSEQGAFVFMNVAAEKTIMRTSLKLAHFIRNNIGEWRKYVRDSHHLEIAEDQIIFVSGTIKTQDWGLGAFTGQENGGAVSYLAQVPFCQGAFSRHAHNGLGTNVQTRTKPLLSNATMVARPDLSIKGAGGTTSSQGYSGLQAAEVKRDQTLFFHYYRVKNRPPKNHLRALVDLIRGRHKQTDDSKGAGVGSRSIEDKDEVEYQSDYRVSVAAVLWENLRVVSCQLQSYDPVEYVLDYILDFTMKVSSRESIVLRMFTFSRTVLRRRLQSQAICIYTPFL